MAHQKPQPAEGAAADVNLATASSEGDRGEVLKRGARLWLGNNWWQGAENQSVRPQCLLRTPHVRTIKMAKMLQEVWAGLKYKMKKTWYMRKDHQGYRAASAQGHTGSRGVPRDGPL